MHLLIDKQVADVQNNLSAWSTLYDTYAAMMYGIILNLTGNEMLAETILEDIFLQWHNQKMPFTISRSLCHDLMRHTYKTTLIRMHKLGLRPISTLFNGHYPLIHLFYFESTTLPEAAEKMALTEKQITKNLHLEFTQLCHQP